MSRHLLLAVALLVAGARLTAGDTFEGRPVVEIAFSPPAQPIPADRLAELISVRSGAPLDSDQLRESIAALFATGRYADIRVDAVPSGGGIKITFITTDNWFIGPVRVLNVKEPPTAGQLLNATKLDLGDLYAEDKVTLAKESLLRLLADNGYYSASIEVDTQAHSDTQQIDITFQVQAGERARFGQVRIVGKPPLTGPEARLIAGWSADRPFTQPYVQRGLDRLERRYRQRGHLQVVARVAARRFAPQSNRVDLDVEILPGPRFETAISGASLSKRQLRRYVPIYEEGTVDRDLLAEGARNLRDYFQTHGYFDAKVDYDQHIEENGVILIEFQATLGGRHTLVELDITGNRYFGLATIRERMYLAPKSLQFRRGRFSQSLLRSDIQAIEELYRSNGFHQVKVEDRVEDDYQGKQGDQAVFLSIHEGAPTLVSKLEITGNRAIPTSDLLQRISSVEGQPFSENNVANDRDQILTLYFSEGFPDASLEWRPKPGPTPQQVELEYTIREGERRFVRQVIVDGYEHTREAVIRRQIDVYASEPLSLTEMIESQRRLYDLGIFSKVDMAVQNRDGREEYRNVLFQVEEARKWTFGLGGGAEIARIGGEDSPTGETDFSPRMSIEVSRLNVFGRANTLSFRSRFSRIQQRGLVLYQAPQWRGRDRLTLTFSSLYDTSRDVRTFTANRLEGALQLQHRISKPSTLFYRYAYRRVKVTSLKVRDADLPLLSRPVRVGLLSATFVQDRRDDPLDAKRGIYNTVDLGIAADSTGSEANFLRLLAQNSTYHPLTRRLLLARTTQVGGMAIFGSLRRVEIPQGDGPPKVEFTRAIPLPERFFSGGANSHRGFSANQAGPRDSQTGFPLGGSGLLLNSLELRFPVRGEDIGGVLFHDAGNVYAKPRFGFRQHQRDSRDFDYMVHAIGGGVRYRTPIGPVRLDLAYSINPPSFEPRKPGGDLQRIGHLQFHFSLGQTF